MKSEKLRIKLKQIVVCVCASSMLLQGGVQSAFAQPSEIMIEMAQQQMAPGDQVAITIGDSTSTSQLSSALSSTLELLTSASSHYSPAFYWAITKGFTASLGMGIQRFLIGTNEALGRLDSTEFNSVTRDAFGVFYAGMFGAMIYLSSDTAMIGANPTYLTHVGKVVGAWQLASIAAFVPMWVKFYIQYGAAKRYNEAHPETNGQWGKWIAYHVLTATGSLGIYLMEIQIYNAYTASWLGIAESTGAVANATAVPQMPAPAPVLPGRTLQSTGYSYVGAGELCPLLPNNQGTLLDCNTNPFNEVMRLVDNSVIVSPPKLLSGTGAFEISIPASPMFGTPAMFVDTTPTTSKSGTTTYTTVTFTDVNNVKKILSTSTVDGMALDTTPYKMVSDGAQIWLLLGNPPSTPAGAHGLYTVPQPIMDGSAGKPLQTVIPNPVYANAWVIDVYPGPNYVWALDSLGQSSKCAQPCTDFATATLGGDLVNGVKQSFTNIAVGAGYNAQTGSTSDNTSTSSGAINAWAKNKAGQYFVRTEAGNIPWIPIGNYDLIPPSILGLLNERDPTLATYDPDGTPNNTQAPSLNGAQWSSYWNGPKYAWAVDIHGVAWSCAEPCSNAAWTAPNYLYYNAPASAHKNQTFNLPAVTKIMVSNGTDGLSYAWTIDKSGNIYSISENGTGPYSNAWIYVAAASVPPRVSFYLHQQL